jgi:hypothetical protein
MFFSVELNFLLQTSLKEKMEIQKSILNFLFFLEMEAAKTVIEE